MCLFTQNHPERVSPSRVFNGGDIRRDFTYIDELSKVSSKSATISPATGPKVGAASRRIPATSNAPYRLFNIGNNDSGTALCNYIGGDRSRAVGKEGAVKELLPLQPGDVPDTFADVGALIRQVDYKPSTPVEVGVANFVRWYRDYYNA